MRRRHRRSLPRRFPLSAGFTVSISRLPSRNGKGDLLRNFRLCVQRGEYVVLVSPDRQLLSRLGRVLTLIDLDWTGAYSLDGREIRRLGVWERFAMATRMGSALPGTLVEDLTVAENLEIPLTFVANRRDERWWYIKQALAAVGRKGELAAKLVSRLSVPQRQLMILAKAIVGEPDLVFLLEPFRNLTGADIPRVSGLLESLHLGYRTVVHLDHALPSLPFQHRIVKLTTA